MNQPTTRDYSWIGFLLICAVLAAFFGMIVYAFSLHVEESQPVIEPGIAVVGAYCDTEGAQRLTEAGEVATCLYGPDGSTGTRLEWQVAR